MSLSLSRVSEQPSETRGDPRPSLGFSFWPPIVIGGLGVLALMPRLTELWSIWMSDSLNSIGILLPLVSLWLGWRVLRSGKIENEPRSWAVLAAGAFLILAAVTLGSPLLDLFLHLPFPAHLVPTGVLVCMYVSGAVLFFLGPRALRKLMFPLALLLFLKPVPYFFTQLVDLPLQYAGARTALAFASSLGIPVSRDGANLYFFGNEYWAFIAPQCNGLHGAVAMGYATLIAGYLFGLPKLWHSLYVAVGVLLAYGLNLVRLCATGLFYLGAHHYPPLGPYAEVVIDYVLGSILFALAAAFLFQMPKIGIRRET